MKRRIFSAGGWTVAGSGLSQAIRFGSNLVMTRLLVPEMFGIIAIALMVNYALVMFSDVGLRQSVVQSGRGNTAVYLNTAWALQILRGALLWILALLVSLIVILAAHFGVFPADSVYAAPILPYVIAVLSAGAVISGFDSTKIFEASRNLSLNRVIQIELAAQVAGLICMLAWVALDRSIWALVSGYLCSTLARTILSHAWLRGVANRWHWDVTAFREIIHFGKWIFLSSILAFLVISSDRLLLGGLVSANLLGVYVIAYLIFSSVQQILVKVISDVLFPALSEVARERPGDLKQNYYRVHTFVAAASYTCAGILAISGQPLIQLLYDHRYDQAGWMLEILAVSLLSMPFSVAGQCFMALGMPRIFSYMLAIQLAAMYLLTPIGFHFWGLEGALWAVVSSNFAYFPLLVVYKIKHDLFDLWKELIPLPFVVLGMIVGKGIKVLLGYLPGF